MQLWVHVGPPDLAQIAELRPWSHETPRYTNRAALVRQRTVTVTGLLPRVRSAEPADSRLPGELTLLFWVAQ